MKILITGASGFIGRKLASALVSAGHRPLPVPRQTINDPEAFADLIDTDTAIINLSGEPIGGGKWTDEKKEEILRSRVQTGKAVVEGIKASLDRPRVVVQASAIGYYGDRGDEQLTEMSSPGSGFLSGVCLKWESSSAELDRMGVRRVIIRSAMVLGRDGGVLPEISRPVLGIFNACPGDGRQWCSWIHIDDEIAAILFLIDNPSLEGPFNLSSPNPLPAKSFFRAVADACGNSLISVPGTLVRMKLGEMGDELLLSSKRVLPERLIRAGFRFKFPVLTQALADIKK